MAEQLANHRQGFSAHRGVAGKRVPHIAQAGFGSNRVPMISDVPQRFAGATVPEQLLLARIAGNCRNQPPRLLAKPDSPWSGLAVAEPDAVSPSHWRIRRPATSQRTVARLENPAHVRQRLTVRAERAAAMLTCRIDAPPPGVHDCGAEQVDRSVNLIVAEDVATVVNGAELYCWFTVQGGKIGHRVGLSPCPGLVLRRPTGLRQTESYLSRLLAQRT